MEQRIINNEKLPPKVIFSIIGARIHRRVPDAKRRGVFGLRC